MRTEYNKRYYAKNKERLIAAMRSYYQTNREKEVARAKEYRDTHREEILEKLRLKYPTVREARKAYRERNRERIIARQRVANKRDWPKRKQHRNTIRQFLWDYLLDHPCVDCGQSDPIVLEFDHVRGEKKFHMSKAYTYAVSTVRAELEKCDVRCANCHRHKTFRECGHGKTLRPDQRAQLWGAA